MKKPKDKKIIFGIWLVIFVGNVALTIYELKNNGSTFSIITNILIALIALSGLIKFLQKK